MGQISRKNNWEKKAVRPENGVTFVSIFAFLREIKNFLAVILYNTVKMVCDEWNKRLLKQYYVQYF